MVYGNQVVHRALKQAGTEHLRERDGDAEREGAAVSLAVVVGGRRFSFLFGFGVFLVTTDARTNRNFALRLDSIQSHTDGVGRSDKRAGAHSILHTVIP